MKRHTELRLALSLSLVLDRASCLPELTLDLPLSLLARLEWYLERPLDRSGTLLVFRCLSLSDFASPMCSRSVSDSAIGE